MKKYGVALLAFTLTSVTALAAANAADMYVAPPAAPGGYKDAPWVPSWSGFYVGGHLGAAWGNLTITDVDDLNSAPGAKFSLHDTAIIGGGQAGYNWQHGNIVYGVELDIGGIGFNKKGFDGAPSTCTPFGIGSGLYGDVTGRLGYALDRTLVYAKGGIAFSDGKASEANSSSCGAGPGSAKTDTFTGWTAGGGVEYSINPAWSLKAEYQHFDFGNEDTVLHLTADFPFRNQLTADAVTVGANYHIGSIYEPLK